MIFSTFLSFGQLTATDFTATDCNGNPHNLFAELNNGKTVVLAWVMPCVGCDAGGRKADSSVNVLLQTFPDSVLLWIVDDGPPSDCNTLSSWTWAQQIFNGVTFGNYSNEIDQDDYGGFGMPHIVVIGADKKIYFNEFNGTADGIYTAIQNAILLATSVKTVSQVQNFTVSPNPAESTFKIISTTAIRHISIASMTGQIIKELSFGTAVLNPLVDISDFASGIFAVTVTDEKNHSQILQLVKTK